MSVPCPHGHSSETSDYCDQCGARISGGTAPAGPASAVVAPPPVAAEPPIDDELDTSPAARRPPCPGCGAPRSGDDRFCERCGYDFANPDPHPHPEPDPDPQPMPPAADSERSSVAVWEAVASVDRRQFERHLVPGIAFPEDQQERRFRLDRAEMRIGRTRARAGEATPEIDLGGSSQDPGISHLHALLERRPDGSYALRDLGSTNGTTVNDDPAPISRETGVPLADGDRIRLGAWTTITLRRR
jgi:hypothetical protein